MLFWVTAKEYIACRWILLSEKLASSSAFSVLGPFSKQIFFIENGFVICHYYEKHRFLLFHELALQD